METKEVISMKSMSFVRIISGFLFSVFLVVGCGPDGGSSGNLNNNVDQPDAYVFPDARPRPDAEACVDRCDEGDVQCVTGGFQVCGNYDADDCLEWGPVVACDDGQKCVDGLCQEACTSACSAGSVRCDPDPMVDGVQTCQMGGEGCYVWSDTVECDEGESCSGGVCAEGCDDECADGSRRCEGEGYQVCGDFDSDDCLEWGPTTDCPSGETCSNGYCGTTCSNECAPEGDTRCDGSDGFQTCSDYDSDPCLEWGPKVLCDAGETCSGGICSVDCVDECDTEGAQDCTASGDGYMVCSMDHDADDCYEWGPVISCDPGDTCQGGECVTPCDCDFHPGVCEPDGPNSTTACPCDPDCGGGTQPCGDDGHCDSWCPPGEDPDCDCYCDYNEYCEAESAGSTDTCECDPDCRLHDYACSDDGHCDTFCPEGSDPDCGVDRCRMRWMSVGWRFADEMWLYDAYENPDPDEPTGGWVLLSPGTSSGTAEIFLEFAAENQGCVDGIRVESYGYDDSWFGGGASMYLYNWDTFEFDLLADERIGGDEAIYTNDVWTPSPYMYCGATKCYVNAKVTAGSWDNTHLWWTELWVHMTP